MAETSIQVQPATAQGQAAPAPLPIKMFLVEDGTNTQVQAMCLTDDQGRAYQPMTEATGQQIVRLLTQLVSMMAVSTGGLLPSDDAAGLSNSGG